jgi:lipoate-protein ligase A
MTPGGSMDREENAVRSGGWEIIDTGERSGAENMAFDESLARRRAEGTGASTLRFFRWKPWAISVGYNQGTWELNAARCEADGIQVVRRPTGGRAILHADELTYSIVMPAGRRSILQIYNDISRALVRGLSLYGVEASLQKSQPNFAEEYRNPSSLPCFSSSARYEIEWKGRKLVGSAQRRYAGSDGDAVLQHGSVLCGPSHLRLADYLSPGDAAVADRIRRVLKEKTVDLAEITGAPVDTAALAGCLRRGFELEWKISFVSHNLSEAS